MMLKGNCKYRCGWRLLITFLLCEIYTLLLLGSTLYANNLFWYVWADSSFFLYFSQIIFVHTNI